MAQESINRFIREEGNKYPEVNKKIWKIIKKLNIQDLIKKTEGFICGGTILSLFDKNKVISEVDISFKNKDLLNKFYKEVSLYDGCELIEDSDFCVHLKYKTKHIKLLRKYCGNPEDILHMFDFTICQSGFYPKHNCFIMHKDFISDVDNKRIIINRELNFPLTSITRISKYIQRGFKISDSESMILALTINKFALNNHDSLIDCVSKLNNTSNITSLGDIYNKLEVEFSTNLR